VIHALGPRIFPAKNSVLGSESESGKKAKPANKSGHYVECKELISVVSTILYEIEDMHCCSECYSKNNHLGG